MAEQTTGGVVSVPTDLFLLDRDQRTQLWRELVQNLERYLNSVNYTRVAPESDIAQIRQYVKSFSFSSPLPPLEALQRVTEQMWQQQVHTPHPCYFGLFNPAPTVVGIMAEALVAAFNPQLASWTQSPFAIEVEDHLVKSLAERFGYSLDCADGTFTTGGAEANQTALLCALHSCFPTMLTEGLRSLPKCPRLYLSQAAHHSFVKASRVAGLGEEAVREISVTSNLEIDVSHLRKEVQADREKGHLPFLLIGTAGTTGSGSVDPLEELARVAREEDLWFHVDAAWGGAAAFVPELRDLLAGIEAADSITFDPHKWLSVPRGCGLFLTRHPDVLHEFFKIRTDYMPKQGSDLSVVHPYAHSLQWSRRFDGLKLFLTLAVSGWDGLTAVLRHQTAMGDYLRARLKECNWLVLNNTRLPLVCFTSATDSWDPDTHQRIAHMVVSEGYAWISTVQWAANKAALRACITNYRTGQKHIETLLKALALARGKL